MLEMPEALEVLEVSRIAGLLARLYFALNAQLAVTICQKPPEAGGGRADVFPLAILDLHISSRVVRVLARAPTPRPQ